MVLRMPFGRWKMMTHESSFFHSSISSIVMPKKAARLSFRRSAKATRVKPWTATRCAAAVSLPLPLSPVIPINMVMLLS